MFNGILIRLLVISVVLSSVLGVAAAQDEEMVQEYSVPAGSHPHDVAPAPDGTVW